TISEHACNTHCIRASPTSLIAKKGWGSQNEGVCRAFAGVMPSVNSERQACRSMGVAVSSFRFSAFPLARFPATAYCANNLGPVTFRNEEWALDFVSD